MKEYGALHNAFQFQYHDSPIHRLSAGWKLILTLAFSAAAVAARDPWTIAVLLVALAVLYMVARLGVSGLWSDLRLFIIQIPIIVGLYLLRQGMNGLWPGLKIGFMILLFFLPNALFLRTTRSSQIMAGLKKILPMSLVFIIFTSLRFVPFFVREIEEIALMQRLRGASVAPRDLVDPRNWKDLFDCLFIPILVRAIKTAEEAARSAEARGFKANYQQFRNPLGGRAVEERHLPDKATENGCAD
jgi:energy-coupling factor transporter transmembrane protein EcfT